MADRHNTNSRITSVNRDAANVWNTRLTGGDAIHFLTDTEAAPIGNYFAFIPDNSAVISSITYLDNTKVSGTITSLTLIAGLKYYIPGGFSTITLSAGTMILFKEVPA